MATWACGSFLFYFYIFYNIYKLIGFQDTEPVKIVTGIRRCGKSSLLKLMVAHLLETGISPEQIIEMNFESYAFKDMTADNVYHYVKERIYPNGRTYLFFDELQRVPNWETAINAFRVDFNCDIYIISFCTFHKFFYFVLISYNVWLFGNIFMREYFDKLNF